MNCFVIMPFSGHFTDVYEVIKRTVEEIPLPNGGQCFRLDEARPAGRITNRLLTELQAASMCVADLTGNTPNVMWEVGYAMALNKPTIIITQSPEELPFDLKDMQSLKYDRFNLSKTLCGPLRRIAIDTISEILKPNLPRQPEPDPNELLVQELRGQVTQLNGRMNELYKMVSQAIRIGSPGQPQARPTEDESRHLKNLEGAWINNETESHIYAEMVDGELVAPYCYGGDDRLVGVYFGWRLVGEHWFARFKWLRSEISGFTFVKQVSVNVLRGAWWYDEEGGEPPSAPPPKKSGMRATWVRKSVTEYPEWASRFIEEIRRDGLQRRMPSLRRPRSITPRPPKPPKPKR